MYRLLLVDDEREIVDWLYDLFQEVPDLELDVYKALSGLEALDILGRTKIDVVISDIKMPGLSGLELLEKVRSRWPLCRFVFLTGYNEFEYVYTAIKYEGVSYLLKTEEDAEIIGQVRHAIADLERHMQDREIIEKVHQYMTLALPSLQRDVVKHIILDPDGAAAATQEKLDEMLIPLRRDRPVYLAAGRFDQMPPDATPAVGVRMAASLRLRAEELLGSSFAHVNLIHQGDIDLVWLLQPTVESEAPAEERDLVWAPLLGGTLEALQDFSRQALGLTTSFAYCTYSAPWEGIEASYATLSRLLLASAGMGRELLLNEKNFTGLVGRPAAPGAGAALTAARKQLDAKALSVLLERGDGEGFLEKLSGAIKSLKDVQSKDSAAAQELYFAAAVLLLGHINRRNLAEKLDPRLEVGRRLMRADRHESWADAADYLFAVARAVFEQQRGAQEKNMRDSVERIQQFIRDHLCEDLSLVRLAEISYFNPSYLSRLFKQATGQNITDYISGLRIERAKVLLEDHTKKINDISSSLGYESQHYFSRFFKKYTGVSPLEYRENIRRL